VHLQLHLIEVADMNPTDPVTVTLQAQEWNSVLAALIEAPYRIAAPLVQKIGEQARGVTGQAKPPNGGEQAHAPD
jgi:hypothetical protein